MATSVPFVTATLRVVWLAWAPADLQAFWIGPAAAWRLTPVVYAHLFHAAERKAVRPETDPAEAAGLVAALEQIYAALVSVYDPADVHPWNEATPPLPELPALPRLETGIPGRLPDVPPPDHGSSSAPPTTSPATSAAAPRKRPARSGRPRKPTAGDAIATGSQSAGMFDGL